MSAFPKPSVAERDRRWAMMRRLMDEHDVGGVMVFGSPADRPDIYLAGESVHGGIIFLPREGEPSALTPVGAVALLRRDDQGVRLEAERWIPDLRVGPPPPLVADRLREAGLDRGRVGVIGLSGIHGVPFGLWSAVLAATPDVTWVDLGRAFAIARLVKSQEEQELARHAAEIGERASEAFLDAAVIGARESDVYAAVEYAITTRGGYSAWPHMILRSGNPLFGGLIEWGWPGGAPPILRPGDAIGAEIFSCYAGFETQQQMHVQFGADPVHERLASAARAAYDAGVASLRPGALFSEVADAMHAEVIAAGAWSRPPQVQTVSPGTFNSAMWINAQGRDDLVDVPIPAVTPADGDFEIEAGMLFAFQPSASAGLRQVCIGGTVLATSNGAEELNSLATRSHVVDV